ncbi:NAD/NADP-dependent betaine aldehyde dehydrogenase [Rubripirellula lacrimiformis]|uniref:NAD/NADP-dependent betaine aldehyde dehydrogenase n=1 Tax=Rubripirellula lacrimiformis TaxID=1930273 RepID=A0A517N812_9BACT|nr:aldehyde dehydrogenase family protein [Rubripirellula lacrimiformis]QDT03279.1 NAD/NADP-dependent betaine aldehyde dehydrogenase [Rubripirellula lacrimiformis]
MSATISSAPSEIKITETQCFIGGNWVPAVSGKTFATINPATEQEIAQVAEGDAADVDAAAKAAREAFENGPWRTMDARDRGRLMYLLADRMEAEIDALAALETLDNGKPLKDSRNVDLPLAIDCLRYYAGYADKIHGSTIPIRGNHFCYTRREPIGVAGQIIPWNFPILMTAWKWGPALAAGCTIVMKPAEQTPLTCLRMAQLAKEVGIPDGVINVVPGFGPTAGAAVVKHPQIDKIAFTGEHRTAQIITRDSADTLKRLTFELGGKSPNVIFADADLDAAAMGAYVGLFLNQGQCCCAGSRVFVESSKHDEFIEKLQALTARRKVGDPFAADTEQGPQVDQAQFDKILSYIDKGKKEGADCISGGNRVGDKGYFIEPTIFDNVRDDMSIATDEIFGPVLSVLTFDDKDDIIQRANNTFFGLAAAVWTRDISVAHEFAARVRAGTIWVNCYDVFDAAAPFGGFKMSGYGRELGEEGLKAYTENKTVTIAL